jgi:hypothetical protein
MTQVEFSRQLGKTNRWTQDFLVRSNQVAVQSAREVAKALISMRAFSKRPNIATWVRLRSLANPPEQAPHPVPLLLFRIDEDAMADALGEHLKQWGHDIPARVFHKFFRRLSHPKAEATYRQSCAYAFKVQLQKRVRNCLADIHRKSFIVEGTELTPETLAAIVGSLEYFTDAKLWRSLPRTSLRQ